MMQPWAEEVAAKVRADRAYYQRIVDEMIAGGAAPDEPGVVLYREIVEKIDKALAVARATY